MKHDSIYVNNNKSTYYAFYVHKPEKLMEDYNQLLIDGGYVWGGKRSNCGKGHTVRGDGFKVICQALHYTFFSLYNKNEILDHF